MHPRRRAALAAAVVAGLGTLTIVSVVVLGGGDDRPPPVVVQPPPAPTQTPTPTPAACSTTGVAFVPTWVGIPGVAKRISVLPLAREAGGVVATPPLTSTGKTEMAFDLGSGIKPGDAAGNALLNAHTWPDGSALGNKLLANLQTGDQIVVHGALGQICYQVTKRVEVAATAKNTGYFVKTGQPQIALVVCSGQRLGPGNWTKRTLWFASPVT